MKKKLKFKVGDILISPSATKYTPLMVTEIVKDKQNEKTLRYYRVVRLDGGELDFPCWPADLVDSCWRLIA